MVFFRKKIVVLLGLSFCALPLYAAKPIDLSQQTPAFLNTSRTASAVSYSETNRNTDFNQTTHVRMQENYQGLPVLGGDFVVHIPQGTSISKSVPQMLAAAAKSNAKMTGIIYQDLAADLGKTAPKNQSEQALSEGIKLYQKENQNSVVKIKNQKSNMVIFVDQKNKAHWAYLVQFTVMNPQNSMPVAIPSYIMDATTFQIYIHWNDLRTASPLSEVDGGGYGGNGKMGKVVYDGLQGNFAKLKLQRNDAQQTCMLENVGTVIKNANTSQVVSFSCPTTNPDHGNVYWDGSLEEVNGGYSPANDALFSGQVIIDMYKNWYNVPPLKKDPQNPNSEPLQLYMVIHDLIGGSSENASFDPQENIMHFGDGGDMLYPLTSLGVGAHEISHGFTSQHSNLFYFWESGGINESFSDMAAATAEYYVTGKNSWQIGPELFKEQDRALRYMDKPSKDCAFAEGGECSVDTAEEVTILMNVHHSSGVFNRAFYLLSNAQGWDPKKAFAVMVQAQNYWNSFSNFQQAGCGVVQAAKDFKYDTTAVKKAFADVGVNTTFCF